MQPKGGPGTHVFACFEKSTHMISRRKFERYANGGGVADMLFCNGEVQMYWWGQRPVHLKAKLNKMFLIKVL